MGIMKRIRRNKPTDIPESLTTVLSPLLARIYAARNVTGIEDVNYELRQLPPFALLKGMVQAADLLVDALEKSHQILIVGDYDADGATSTALAVRALRAMGGRVDYLIPNRFEYGYGLTPEIVAVARKGMPDLLVTVDNGIASHEGVCAAKALGIKVLITDHHLPGASLPEADAIVNPNQPGDQFPGKAMAGVGVIFYVMLALRARLRENGWFERQAITLPNLADLLDLVALGTVADVVTLDHLNRTLVAQGLARIRAGRGCAGIRAMLEVSGREAARLNASDLGFSLGPRLNAAGRLEDMSLGVACLLTDDMAQAREYAYQLHDLNLERRAIEQDMKQDAQEILLRMEAGAHQGSLPWGLCLFDPAWHQGVIGILASRVKDQHHRPVIAFADAGNGDLKGSARSIPNLHIRDVLDTIATRHPGLIRKFGGHAMAAGLSLPASHLEPFSAAFDEEVHRLLSEDDLQDVLLSDGELAEDLFTLEVAKSLQLAGPWGQSFPQPLFDGEFILLERKVIGGQHLKMTVRHPASRDGVEAIAFQASDADWPVDTTRVRLVYQLDINYFRGRQTLQLLVKYLEPQI